MPRERSIVSWGFAVGNLGVAIVMLAGVFAGLPVRWWVVDVPSAAFAILLLVSAFGLARASSWSLQALRVCAGTGLAIGLLAVAALALSAAYLSGTHGALGQSGTLTMTLIIALALPYLIFYPGAQLLWIHRQLHRVGQ